MTLFPISPINGKRHSFEGKTWEYNDGVWDLLSDTFDSGTAIVKEETPADDDEPKNTLFTFDIKAVKPVEGL